jgi:tetratricopeptide (TPR) repeat protein
VQIARDLDDPASLAYALDGHYCAILGPDTLVERAALANEIVELAQQVGDSERLAAGRLYRAIANMELGRLAGVQAELETMAGEAAELRQPAQLWVATVSRANLALFRGRFADAQSLVHEALTLGQRAQRRDAVLSHRLQLFVLDREVGGNPEIEALITQSVSEFPMRPVFRCALAYIHARNLDASRARAAIDELAQSDFGAIQRDNEYLFSLGFAADAVCAQGDVSTAAVLYDLMAPFAAVNAANADEISTGSVSRTLGVLAAAMARWDDASHHFVAAIEHNREMGARPWLAHSYHDYAQMLLARGGTGDEEAAEELLATARGEYEALGMDPWVARTAPPRTTA